MIAVILALSQAGWTTIGLGITTLGGFATVIVQNRRLTRGVSQVNKAVNNVPEGELPLIKRVQRLEQRQDAQTRWLVDALQSFGRQLGVVIPPHPDQGDEAA